MTAPNEPDHQTAADEPADAASFPAVRREVGLRADPDAVWEQLSGADALSGWLADEVDVEVRPGARGTVRDRGAPARPVRVEDVDPGRRLSLVWTDAGAEETLVDLTLVPAEDGLGTRLVVVEVPLRTLELVGPALQRVLAAGGGGAGAATASAALAGCR